jgi:hypothetical protein
MANIKQVEIRGTLPFNITDNPEVRDWLGVMNGPSYGLRISYGNGHSFVPNQNGGRTAIYSFSITGREGVWTKHLIELVKLLQVNGAKISVARAADLDDQSGWFRLI